MSIKKFDEIVKEASNIVKWVDIEYKAPAEKKPKEPVKEKSPYNPKNVFTDEDEKKFLDTLAVDADKFCKIRKGKDRFVRSLNRATDMYLEVKNSIGDGKNDYNEGLKAVESSGGNLTAVKGQYLGEFQLGNRALVQAGFKERHMYRDKDNHKHYTYTWSKLAKSYGVDSRDDFLHNERAQEVAMERFTNKNWEMIQALHLDDYIGKEINGVKITENGLKYACHLVGIGSLEKALKNKEHKYDGNGISCLLYVVFGGLTQPGQEKSPILQKIEEMRVFERDALQVAPLDSQHFYHNIPERLKTPKFKQ